MRFAVAAICSAALLAPSAAAACSVVDSYRVPTNLELATDADAIVLGRVTAGALHEDDPFASTVTVHPLSAIKGQLPAEDFTITGMALAEGDAEGFGVLSNPYDFEGAHPVSYIGACVRYIFPLGTTALFFLDREEGEWRPAGGPFSRWAEDVPGEDAPWVQLSVLYVHAAGMPPEQRRAMLEDQREALLARADEPVAQLMAQDIARQLEGPNEPWNSRMGRELGFGDEDEAEEIGSAVEAALDAMRADKGE